MPSRENKRAQAILAAAEELLEESGIESLTARAIAERAGVQKGLVFYYWDSTAELVDHVLERYYQQHLEVLRAGMSSTNDDLRFSMHRLIDGYLDFMEQNRNYARIIQHQLSSGDEPSSVVRGYLGKLMALTTDMLGDTVPDTGPLSAKHFFLSLSGVVVNYFTYAPTIGADTWGSPPMEAAALGERREHIHWIIDAWLTALGVTETAADEPSRLTS